ncbi:chaplin [Actinomadura hibisca]|uniref:chaplin n=1 Tax=Actinomadura hibisca TaxID=68565 RepID=UPI000835E165|nr:chaplin [Actinomadura hibisca]
MRNWAKHTSRAALVAAGAVVIGTSLTSASAIADIETSGKGSVLGGNQLNAPVSVPVNLCGNAVAIVGAAKAKCLGAATVTNHDSGGHLKSSGEDSVLGGNQANIPISVPVNVCGNSAAVLGLAKSHCKGGAHVINENGGADLHTSGKESVLGGNQGNIPISVPVNVCGNSLDVAGAAKSGCKGAATVTNAVGHAMDASDPLPSTKRQAVVNKLSKNKLVGKLKSKVKRPSLAVPNQVEPAATLPSTRRMATGAVQEPETPRVQPGEVVRNMVKALGVPVPNEDGTGDRPRLPLEGLPVNIGGTPVFP